MGVGMDVIEFFDRSISRTVGDIRSRRMAELGDQKLWAMIATTPKGGRVWAKEWFEARGCHHYSIDIHGLNGAYPLDLSQPIEDAFWHDNFDIVTNFGTSEHVEDQYECWRNIHHLGRPGCVYIHVLPEYGIYSPDHSKYQYTQDFFKNLCEANGYTLILNESLPALGHVAACYIKPRQNVFTPLRDEIDAWIKSR